MKLLSKIILLSFITLATGGLAATVTPTPKTTYGSWDVMRPIIVPKGTMLSVGGWGADTAATPTSTSHVVAKVFVDGKLMAEVPMKSDRPDVKDYYGFSHCGFDATIDTSTLGVGEHTVEVHVGGGPSGWNKYSTSISGGVGKITVTAK